MVMPMMDGPGQATGASLDLTRVERPPGKKKELNTRPDTLKLVDLRKLEQGGTTLKLDKITPAKLRVSPFGDAVAAFDTSAVLPTVKVWSFDDKPVQTVVLDPTNAAVEWFDFAAKGQLISL